MKMKRFLSGILTIILMFSICIPASAEDISVDNVGHDVLVSYGATGGFTVTIPSDFEFDEEGKATADISASNVLLAEGKSLDVIISGHDYTNRWELLNTSGVDSLGYMIGSTEGGCDITNNGKVLSVVTGESIDDTKTTTIYFEITDGLYKSGDYSDTLTFTVEINDRVVTYAENFADNTWIDIIYAVQNNEVPDTWAVKDTKPMIIDGQEYNIQIIGKNHDTYASGGVAPLTFWLVELYNDKAQMNETQDNTTGWANSKMRTTTLVDIFSKMPSAIRTAIRPVNKQTLKGDYSGLETTADKLFLFSETEIFGTTSQSNGFAEGAQYELNAGYWKYWYKDYVGGTEGDLPWFLRGPNATDSKTFSGVNYFNSVDDPYADTLQGFSFGFCF